MAVGKSKKKKAKVALRRGVTREAGDFRNGGQISKSQFQGQLMKSRRREKRTTSTNSNDHSDKKKKRSKREVQISDVKYVISFTSTQLRP